MSTKKLVVVSTFVMGIGVSGAEAQTLFGARLGAYVEQEELFLGGEVLTHLQDSFYLNPNVEWVLADNAKQATFNFDFHYDFAHRGELTFWVGAGLGVLYFNPDGPRESNTDLGLNLLFGTAFLRGRDVIPYLQAKVIVADDSELVVGFGVRF